MTGQTASRTRRPANDPTKRRPDWVDAPTTTAAAAAITVVRHLDFRRSRWPAMLITFDFSRGVGAAVGFEVPATFRERFREIVGVSPAAYRRAFAAYRPIAPIHPDA